MIKRFLITLTIPVLMLLASAGYAAGIGVIDMQQIFTTSPEVKQINEQLKTEFADRKTKLDDMTKTLQADMQNYQKNKSVMSKTSLTDLEKKITTEQQQLQQAGIQFQKDVYAAQSEKTKAFLNKVKAVVKTVALKKDLTAVLPKGALLYYKADLDITSEVMSDLTK
jgi:Skp family chaperone for outer membrane proteins